MIAQRAILVVLTAACLASPKAAAGPGAEGERTEAAFRSLREPVLGFQIEAKDDPSGFCRLIRLSNTFTNVIAVGTFDHCERELVSALEREYGPGQLNVPLKTFGRNQFWGDAFVFQGWRIQEHVYTGHYRLLDPDDLRQAWGTYEACRAAFEAVRIERGLKRNSRHLVLLIHGMGRTRKAFSEMAQALEAAGYEVASVSYPSTRQSIREHAEQIRRVIENAEGIEQVSVVTHSLGGLVTRELFAGDFTWPERRPAGRIVMLAPPNQGNPVATFLEDWLPYRAVLGEVGQELAGGRPARLPVPSCPFGIIAGGTGSARGLNPVLGEDNDGLVRVEDTRLPGASDFLVVPANHTRIMEHPQVIEATLNFLRSGSFSLDSALEKPRINANPR